MYRVVYGHIEKQITEKLTIKSKKFDFHTENEAQAFAWGVSEGYEIDKDLSKIIPTTIIKKNTKKTLEDFSKEWNFSPVLQPEDFVEEDLARFEELLDFRGDVAEMLSHGLHEEG